jgi:hypothetical protein
MTQNIEEVRSRAAVARANAQRFAEGVEGESDKAVQIYLRFLAASWARVAEDHEFILEMDENSRRTSIVGAARK